MKTSEFTSLQNEKDTACISIILPTHRLAPERRGDELALKKVISQVEPALAAKYSSEENEDLLNRLNELVAKIDFDHNKDGIGIFVSRNFNQIVQFDFPVTEKLRVDDSFEIRELLYLSDYDQPYYLLEINEKFARLFKGIDEELQEVRDSNFPAKFKDLYEYSTPSRGSSYTGSANVKEFEKDKSVLEQIRIKDFLRDVDRPLSQYLNGKIPLIIMGVEKYSSYFKELSRHQNNITDIVFGNYTHSTEHELAMLALSKVRPFIDKEKMLIIQEFKEKNGQGLGFAGIQDIWLAAQEGRAQKLLVEKDFVQIGFIGRDDDRLYLTPPRDLAYYIVTDVVNEIIKSVLEKNGEVVVFDNDQLEFAERMALITRY